MTEFTKPSVEYFELWPLLVVFGAACLGVVVEAFAPRAARYVCQVVLALAGLVGAHGGRRPRRPGRHDVRRRCRPRHPRGRRHDRRRRAEPLHLGPRAGPGHRRRPALRGAPPRRRLVRLRRPGVRRAGHRRRDRGARGPPRAHRGLPADDVRGLRDDALPGRQRPADDVRRPRGPLAPALPAVRAGASSPAAEPGGRPQVLPARCLLVGLLPLRRRAALRLRRVDGLRR